MQMQMPQRRFMELSIAGSEKALYIPSDSVLTYETVPKDKNPHFPDEGTFIRYDFGEGLAFAIVNELIDVVKEQVGTDGFLGLHLIEDSELFLRQGLVVAMQEQEDEGISATKLSVTMGGQVGSLLVKETFKEIQALQGL